MPPNSYKIPEGHLITRWAKNVDPECPHPEYPRPQFKRAAWQNLNGLWDYAITGNQNKPPETFTGQILVPFPIESALSGVKRSLKPDETLWYHRTFSIPEDWEKERFLLHFGAADWACQVFLNGALVGSHQGGYDPFSFEITDWMQKGENTLLVSVTDPTDTQPNQRGKQVHEPGFIWYTASSGIWQTVWIEPVPQSYLEMVKITPDVDRSTIEITCKISSERPYLQVRCTVFDGDDQVAEEIDGTGQPLELAIPAPQLWSPTSPHLYDLEITLLEGETEVDQVRSYFGMRKFSLERDKNGHLRFCLNNQPLFLYGPLDQGYWPDGLYTPPTDEAMRWEIAFIKDTGFNMLRKHIKVEPARYYYHCDRAGIIVWQDMVSGGISPKPIWFVVAQWFKGLRDDWAYWRLGRRKRVNRQQFKLEYQRMIDALHNVTSLAIWCPFNEGWGQFDAAQIADWTKDYDSTRLVDHASGWFDQGAGDFKSEHVYFKPLPKPEKDSQRGWVLSEFGGYSLAVEGHTWQKEDHFGYKKFASKAALTEAYLELLDRQLKAWIAAGLSAAVYTQTTDVEVELNGFLTYDREVVKMDLDALKKAHIELIRASSGEET